MQIKPLPPYGPSTVSQHSPLVEYQRTADYFTSQDPLSDCAPKTSALWRRKPVRLSLLAISGLAAACGVFLSAPTLVLTGVALGAAQIVSGGEDQLISPRPDGRTAAFMKVYSSAVRGDETLFAELEEKLAREPETVGIVYDIWKKGSDGAARKLLEGIDVTHHARNAIFNPDAVFALSFLREAGNKAAEKAMVDLDAMEIAAIARKNPHAVFALTHLKRAGNEIAAEMMVRMIVTDHAREAERNPFAVYALSHLAKAGNAAASNAMRELDVRHLAERIGSDEHALRAINVLFEAGNDEALVAVISRIPGMDEETIRTKAKAARANPLALIDTVDMMRSAGRETRGIMKRLDISGIHIDTSWMSDEDRWALVDVLQELTAIGNESAFKLLCNAARYNCWAVWVLDRLKFRHSKVAKAMENLDVSRYAEYARSAPSVVFTLDLLAHTNNADAIEIMRNLDPSELIAKASSFRDFSETSEAHEAAKALQALARYDNSGAEEWFRTRKKKYL